MRWIISLIMAIGFVLGVSQGFAAPRYGLGDIPLPKEIYNKHLKVLPRDMVVEAVLPPSYDARIDGLVTPAKDQGSCGSCWAFASVGAMESHMLKSYQFGPEDLSEQQQVSCNTAMWGCDGGSSNAIRYWEDKDGGKGPLDESYFPYTSSDGTPCQEDWIAQLDYRVIDWHTVAESDFKNSLITYGPSYWRYDVHDDFYEYWSYGDLGEVYVNTTSHFIGGHAVLLIGWDDSKGAYLCKNSWGENGGPNGDGTFWIAYTGHVADLNFGMANFSLTSLSCATDTDCDDGVYCNGQETCNQADGSCQAGIPVDCNDDGIFCNGSEVCDETNQSCGSSGNPCQPNEICDELSDQCISMCGNGVCNEGENCTTCPDDCIGGSSGGTCEACFKGVCDEICHPVKEGADCSDCWSTYCCGDGVCEGEEDSFNCAIDCPVPWCGDGICNGDEDYLNCAVDCPEHWCGDGVCEGDENYTNCPSDCPPPSSCLAKKELCQSNDECCSGRCNNGKCR